MTKERTQEAGGGFGRGKLQFEVVLAIDGSERFKTDWTANRRIRGRCGANTSCGLTCTGHGSLLDDDGCLGERMDRWNGHKWFLWTGMRCQCSDYIL